MLYIQNVGTNPLFVSFGAGGTSSVYDFILKADTGAAIGAGGIMQITGEAVYMGIVTVAGTTPSYVAFDL
jgi:hypothetical protein